MIFSQTKFLVSTVGGEGQVVNQPGWLGLGRGWSVRDLTPEPSPYLWRVPRRTTGPTLDNSKRSGHPRDAAFARQALPPGILLPSPFLLFSRPPGKLEQQETWREELASAKRRHRPKLKVIPPLSFRRVAKRSLGAPQPSRSSQAQYCPRQDNLFAERGARKEPEGRRNG